MKNGVRVFRFVDERREFDTEQTRQRDHQTRNCRKLHAKACHRHDVTRAACSLQLASHMSAALKQQTTNIPYLQVPGTEEDDDDSLLGQFIPIHYHYQMLNQEERIGGFERAIAAVVKPGMKVLELGGGTGVLSFFAARAGAAKVYCVERAPHVARAARQFLAANRVADRVTVVNADATEYLPPEPVDVVIVEMLHTAMLREKQMSVIASFKERYLARFGGDCSLPIFLPEAAVLAVQPVYTDFTFHGYHAAVPMFVDGSGNGARVVELGERSLYAAFLYADAYGADLEIDACVPMMQSGVVNSLRFSHKNLLAIVGNTSIDWDMHELVLPLAAPIEVMAGDQIHLRFSYAGGDSFLAIGAAIHATRVDADTILATAADATPRITEAPQSGVTVRASR